MKKNGRFLQFMSACAASGNYGCETWINTDVDFGNGRKKVFVTEDDVKIVVDEPRLLVLVISFLVLKPLFLMFTLQVQMILMQ